LFKTKKLSCLQSKKSHILPMAKKEKHKPKTHKTKLKNRPKTNHQKKRQNPKKKNKKNHLSVSEMNA